jgi:hypothetical protein
MSTDEKDAHKKALDISIEMTKQLITLATAVITITVGIMGLLKPIPKAVAPGLVLLMIFEIISVIFGILVYGAITAALSKFKGFNIVYDNPVRGLALGQWVMFLFGPIAFTLSFVLFSF